MTHEPSDGVEPDGERVDGWPARLAGVTETVVATEGPNGHWNQAALGISPPEDGPAAIDRGSDRTVTARTFENTRTRRNLDARGEGFVQFTPDPVDFVTAALDVYETDRPILERASAWVEIRAEAVDARDEAGTEVVTWTLEPRKAAVRDRSVPTTNRGYGAVVEASVAASRIGAPEYDDRELRERVEWLAEVVDRCGGPPERTAFDRIQEEID